MMRSRNKRAWRSRRPGRGGRAFCRFRLCAGLLACLLVVSWHPVAGAASSTIDKQYRQAKLYYQNLLSTDRGKDRRNWLHGAQAFRKLYQAHQDHEVAPKSLFMLGNIYQAMFQRSGNPLDLGESIAYYEDVVSLYPKHRLADDALFLVGATYLRDKSEPQKAARIFAKIVALYPDGDMAAGAAEQLWKLKGDAYRASPAAVPGELRREPPSGPRGKAGPTAQNRQLAEMLPIRYWSNNNYTRVVIETTAPVRYRKHLLEKNGNRPRRLYVDLVNCRVSPRVKNTVPIEDGLLRQVRNAQFSPDTVRIVLDTQSNISDYKIFSLDDPSRVVIDVKGSARETGSRTGAQDGDLSLARQLGLGIRRIVIDPGHGGKDPGTVSASGLKEKDITLRVAKKLARELRGRLHCDVILTRDRDVFIPLEERTAIANSKEGDLFISIHVNAAPTKAVKGIETYVLDLASNKDAMRVAAQENATSSRNISDLQAILLDLMRNSKVNESAKLAELVQETMVSGLGRRYRHINDLGVKKAPFIVLIGAQMPAILTEIAFLSNPAEEKRLRSDRYLTQVAKQIAAGISQYATNLNLANNRLYAK